MKNTTQPPAGYVILWWVNHLQLPIQIPKPIIRNPREVPQTPTSRGLRNTPVGQSLSIAISNPQPIILNPREVPQTPTSRGLRNTLVGQSLTIAISNPQAHYS